MFFATCQDLNRCRDPVEPSAGNFQEYPVPTPALTGSGSKGSCVADLRPSGHP
jgi:hypothetical protein